VGQVGNAALFDGSNYFTVTNTALNIQAPLSIACWIYYIGGQIENMIYCGYGPSPFPGFAFATRSNSVGFWNSANWFTSASVLVQNAWSHIAATIDIGGTLKFYINGALDTTLTVSTPSLYTGEKAIGAVPNSALPGGPFPVIANTRLDEIGIWNRALTGTEITDLYNSGSGLTYPFV
jgi:hypothetical protein